MKANEYKILEECVERGVDYGYQRAFKHTDNPSEDVIKECISRNIMMEICEYFNFEDNKEL